MKRPGQPVELATAYVMLADPLSSYVSGATIAVTGGKPSCRSADDDGPPVAAGLTASSSLHPIDQILNETTVFASMISPAAIIAAACGNVVSTISISSPSSLSPPPLDTLSAGE